jgi:hypothetical protein
MVLIAWIFTLAAVAAVVLLVARWAFTKAESKDVPEVLTGLAHLLRAAPWTKDLTGLVRGGSATGAQPPRPAAFEVPTDDELQRGRQRDDIWDDRAPVKSTLIQSLAEELREFRTSCGHCGQEMWRWRSQRPGGHLRDQVNPSTWHFVAASLRAPQIRSTGGDLT